MLKFGGYGPQDILDLLIGCAVFVDSLKKRSVFIIKNVLVSKWSIERKVWCTERL